MEDGSGTEEGGGTETKSTFTLSITGPYRVFGPLDVNVIMVIDPVAVNRNVNGVNVWVDKSLLKAAANSWSTSDPAETMPVLLG